MDWTGSRRALHSTKALPKFGSVVRTSHPSLPWHVAGLPAAEDAILIEDFLITLVANDCSPQTVRSYAFDLLRWWRFLAVAGNRWDTARREDVRDLVLWMRQPQPPDGRRAYRPASINHALSVLSVFYEHQARQGRGPVMNPVPAPAAGVRRFAHHDPLDPYGPQQRAPYRQRVVDGPPRALSENVVNKVFDALTSTRDRALIAMYLATGARASELLGMRGRDVDWGNQSIAVVSKGSRAYQWVPTSPDSLNWLRLYLNEMPSMSAENALWWTLRRPYRPLQYSALRAVLERANRALGTRITLHDFRHTCATRLANDPSIPLTDVQAVLRHKHLTTTSRYIHIQTEEMVERVRRHHVAPSAAVPTTVWGYNASDMADLFGELQ